MRDSGAARAVREEGWYLLEILALTGFLVSQPVLDTFGRSPETFIARGSDRAEIVGFAIAVAALPALAVWALALITRLAGGARRSGVHVAAIAALVGLLAARITDRLSGAPLFALATIGVAAGVGAALLYARTTWARLYVRVASAAPPAFAAVFLLASPTADLVLGHTVEAADVEVSATAPSILFIVLDQLPTASLLDGHGRIDADLFPNFARLADQSTWYRNATTVAPVTNMAVPAILTGNLPKSQYTAAIASNYPNNLFTLLGGSYDLNVSEPSEALCPTTLCRPRSSGGLAALLGDAADVAGDINTEDGEAFLLAQGITSDRAGYFEKFADSIAPAGDRPVMDYVHVLLPHDPLDYLPNGVEYPAPDNAVGLTYFAWGDEHGVAVGRQRHLLQVQLTDRLIGRVLDNLEASGRWDDTLIVLTADHGEAFTYREGFRGASEKNYEQIMWTPLLIKEPHQDEGRIDDRNAWSVDVLPTVADILDVEIPADWDILGDSLIGTGATRDPEDKILAPHTFNYLRPAADGLVHVDGEEGFDRLLAWSAAPPGDDDLRIWRQGEYGPLVGTRPQEHTIGEPTPFEGWLAEPDAYTDVDLGHDPPVHLDGAYVDTEPGAVIAVAVNGVIGGWGPTVAGITQHNSNFWTLLPLSLLRDGTNEIQFYALSGPADDVTLSPVPMRDG